MCVNFDPGAHVIYASDFAFETGCDILCHRHYLDGEDNSSGERFAVQSRIPLVLLATSSRGSSEVVADSSSAALAQTPHLALVRALEGSAGPR